MPEPPFRAVIVDDESAAREAIAMLLEGQTAIEVVGEAANGRYAVDVVRRESPDLLFLDVQMPDLDGFQVLEALGADVPRAIVFVTAHDEHALRAFDVHALDYLLKPFGRPRFQAAVARAVERLRAHDALTRHRAHAAIETATPPNSQNAGVLAAVPDRPRRIGVRHGATTTVIEHDAIDWIEACGDYVRVHAGGKSMLMSASMNDLERLLDADVFVRVHRSITVNLRRVRELERDADGSGSVLLADGVRLRVARGRWDALVMALGLIQL
ncbi:MAG: LytTR family DNA-binding domain-containing protein [Gemmatimonadetes bacterium]|nr:LytTR family DNA-binding domain-containing protein [Gemmatimonadota bacterium]